MLSIGHMFGHVVYHLKGTIADVEGEQVPYGKLSEFHFCMISVYLRQINLSIIIKCPEFFSQNGLYSVEYWS